MGVSWVSVCAIVYGRRSSCCAVYFLWHMASVFYASDFLCFFVFLFSIVYRLPTHTRCSLRNSHYHHHTVWKCSVNGCAWVNFDRDKNWKNDKRKTTNTIIVTLCEHSINSTSISNLNRSQFIPATMSLCVCVQWIECWPLFSLPFCYLHTIVYNCGTHINTPCACNFQRRFWSIIYFPWKHCNLSASSKTLCVCPMKVYNETAWGRIKRTIWSVLILLRRSTR